MIHDYQLDQSHHSRLFKSAIDNFLLEYGGLPHVLPFAAELDLGHLTLEPCRSIKDSLGPLIEIWVQTYARTTSSFLGLLLV